MVHGPAIRGQIPAGILLVRTKRARDPSFRLHNGSQRFTGRGIPGTRGSIIARRENASSVRAEDNLRYRGVMPQGRRDRLARFGIPDSAGVILARRADLLAVAAKAGKNHIAAVTESGTDRLAIFGIPDLGGAVGARGQTRFPSELKVAKRMVDSCCKGCPIGSRVPES